MLGAILWNAVTSPETVLNANSVKTKLYNNPYFIVLASSVKILEVKATFTEYSDIVIYHKI